MFSCLHDVCRQFLPILPLLPILGEAVTSTCISFPHRNLQGHEGEEVTIFAYSNCDEVEILVNGKKIGKKQMPKNGHLTWKAIYQPGKVVAVGYKNGKRVLVETEETRI